MILIYLSLSFGIGFCIGITLMYFRMKKIKDVIIKKHGQIEFDNIIDEAWKDDKQKMLRFGC